MPLTTAQLAILKTDIAADPALNTIPNTADGNLQIAAAYNALASPAFLVWKTLVRVADVKQALVWTEFIGLQVSARDTFQFMLSNGNINPSDVNIRQGIQDVFTPGGDQTKTNLLAISKRNATRAEKLFATPGAGAATMTFEGFITGQDVEGSRQA